MPRDAKQSQPGARDRLHLPPALVLRIEAVGVARRQGRREPGAFGLRDAPGVGEQGDAKRREIALEGRQRRAGGVREHPVERGQHGVRTVRLQDQFDHRRGRRRVVREVGAAAVRLEDQPACGGVAGPQSVAFQGEFAVEDVGVRGQDQIAEELRLRRASGAAVPAHGLAHVPARLATWPNWMSMVIAMRGPARRRVLRQQAATASKSPRWLWWTARPD